MYRASRAQHSIPEQQHYVDKGVVQGGWGQEHVFLSESQVKSSQGLLFSEAKKPYAEAVGQTGAQGLVRGCGPHCPPVSRKNPARDEASGAPRAGRGSASFSGLISGVRVLSPALSGGRPGFRGG